MLQKIQSTYNKLMGVATPAEQFMLAHEQRTRFTPDINWLTMKADHFLFVPDDLKRGFPNHEWIRESATLITTVITKKENYVLWTKRYNGGKASALAVEAGPRDPKDKMQYDLRPKPARLRGQLFLMPTDKLFELDPKMANGIYSERSKINVQLPWSSHRYVRSQGEWKTSDEPNYIRAHAYFSPEEVVDQERNGSLTLAKRFTPAERPFNLKLTCTLPYYEFTRSDLNGS